MASNSRVPALSRRGRWSLMAWWSCSRSTSICLRSLRDTPELALLAQIPHERRGLVQVHEVEGPVHLALGLGERGEELAGRQAADGKVNVRILMGRPLGRRTKDVHLAGARRPQGPGRAADHGFE